MTIKDLKQEIKTIEQLKSMDLQNVYKYQTNMEYYYTTKDTFSTFSQLAHSEFSKARNLTKWVEKNYTVSEEMAFRHSRKPQLTSFNNLYENKLKNRKQVPIL